MVLCYLFAVLLIGCGGGGSGGGTVAVITGANPLQDILANDSKNTTITINSNGKTDSLFNGTAGLMTLEVPEENTLDSHTVIKVSERLSNESENSFLAAGSVIYTINPIRNDFPIKLTTKPLKLIFTNEDKLSKAQSYYVGIKEIDGGKWQFASLYAANSSSRASIGPKGPFEFNLYKENVYVALFADLNNSAEDLSRVLGINASMSASVVHSYNDKYTEDIRVNIKLSGDNLGKLKADDINVKIGFGCQDKNTSSRIGIDSGTAKYPICDSINKYELAGENYAYYYKFSPLSTNFKSQSVPEFSFDLNLKGTPLSGFSNDFVVEISNANDNALPFCYFYPVHFNLEEKEPESDEGSKPDEESKPGDETKPDDETKPGEESKPSDETKPSEQPQPGDETKPGDETQPDDEPQTLIPANVSLKSSKDDFKILGDKIELLFDKDIPWAVSDKNSISIDNGANVSSCEYSSRVLSLNLNNRLKYDTDYKVSIKGLKYVKDSSFTFKTEKKASVSLKSSSSDFPVDSGVIELQFSKDILWNQNYSENITIDHNAEISDSSYSNKVLKVYLKNNLLYNTHYNIRIAGIDAVEDNDSLEFTTVDSVFIPVITGDESNQSDELPGLCKLKPTFVIDFGKIITNQEQALSKIKLNGNTLPQSCTVDFLDDKRKAVLTFTEELEFLSVYKLNIDSFLEEDGAIIASASSDYIFKTIPPVEIRGSGTENDPFQIYTEAHLRKLNETEPVNYREGGYYFKQMNDIVLKDRWVPIGISYEDLNSGYQAEPFIGTYNGGGFCVSGVDIVIPARDNVDTYYGIGLFGLIDNSKIENLTIRDFRNSTDQNFNYFCVGAVVGSAENSKIKNVNVCGNIRVNTPDSGGGLIGYAYLSSIDHCSVSSVNGLIEGKWNMGGLVGYFEGNSTITNAFSNVSITGSSYVGGLVGYLGGIEGAEGPERAKVLNCYSNSNISALYYSGSIGGLLGSIYCCNIGNCYSSGNISINGEGADCVGTIVGFYENYYSTSTVENTFSSSNIIIQDLNNYSYDDSNSCCYDPYNEDISLWWLRSTSNNNLSSYEYNESGSNYAGNGYKSQLNWDSNIWSNLTEGQLPKLAGFQNQ